MLAFQRLLARPLGAAASKTSPGNQKQPLFFTLRIIYNHVYKKSILT